jgi:hypothetical protein
MLTVVVSAEEQFGRSRQDDADIGGRTAPVAQVVGVQRLRWGHRSGHVASLPNRARYFAGADPTCISTASQHLARRVSSHAVIEYAVGEHMTSHWSDLYTSRRGRQVVPANRRAAGTDADADAIARRGESERGK